MQDTAEGFGQPIRQIFEPFFRMERHLPSPFDTGAPLLGQGRRSLLARALPARSRAAPSSWPASRDVIQQGRISIYLTYSFCTLLALLFFVR